MKRLIAGLTIGLLLTAIAGSTAQAHVLESSNGVSAILHMPPDDVPLAGRPTTVELAFASAIAGFDIKDYRIEVRLLEGSDTVTTAEVQPADGSGRNASATLTFPEHGAYRLAVQGTALGKQRPANFDLVFSVRAIQADGSEPNAWQAAGSDFWALSLGSLAVLGVIASYNIRRGGRYT